MAMFPPRPQSPAASGSRPFWPRAARLALVLAIAVTTVGGLTACGRRGDPVAEGAAMPSTVDSPMAGLLPAKPTAKPAPQPKQPDKPFVLDPLL